MPTAYGQLALGLNGDWRERIRVEFVGWSAARKFLDRHEFTIEEFRALATNQPQRDNAWGSLPQLLLKWGYAEPTFDDRGEPKTRPAFYSGSKGHQVRIWRLT